MNARFPVATPEQQSSASERDTILLEAHARIEAAEYPEAIDNTKHYYFGHVDRMHLAQTLSFTDRLLARDAISRFAADAQMAYRGRVQRVKAVAL